MPWVFALRTRRADSTGILASPGVCLMPPHDCMAVASLSLEEIPAWSCAFVASSQSLHAGAQGERPKTRPPVLSAILWSHHWWVGAHSILLIKLTAVAPAPSVPRPWGSIMWKERKESCLSPEPCAARRGSEDGHF